MMTNKTEIFINKAKLKHGDKYDYSKVNYIKSSDKVCIICPIHGEFWQTPANHLKNRGCPKCGIESSRNAKKLSVYEIIKKANEIHNNKYDYSKLEDKKIIELNTIICPIHGEFTQSMNNHINNKQGCPKCAQLSRNEKQTSNTDEFIEKAKKIHGDRYDYSLVEYNMNYDKVKILCKEHGVFEQLPGNHLKGQGCPICGTNNMVLKQQKTLDGFIIDAKKIHGDKYNYNKSVYVNCKTKLKIICPEHGEFYMTPSSHLSGRECPICTIEKNKDLRRKTNEEFINDSIKVHGDKYDYSKINYINSFENVLITCKKHGDFLQTPTNHLQGKGCPKCSYVNTSIEEFVKKILKNNNIIFETKNRKLLNGKELDIYIPDLKLAFELNGIYYHNELFVDKNYHLNKTNECEEMGIKLIHIFEDEINLNPEIVESRILNLINKTSEIIYARKCEIRKLTYNEANYFYNLNHLQHKCIMKYSYGLFYDNKLVSAMSFSHVRKNLGRINNNENEYELIRFCNKMNTTVVGGASKLLKYFIKEHKPSSIQSYADRRWSDGNLYEKMGFVLIHNTKPNYFYVVKNKRENRFNYRKDILIKQGFDKDKSEHEIMLERKIYRIYDCGSKLYKLNLNESK